MQNNGRISDVLNVEQLSVPAFIDTKHLQVHAVVIKAARLFLSMYK